MTPEINNFSHPQSLMDEELLPVMQEDYYSPDFDPSEAVNSGGVEVRADKAGKRYYTIGAQIPQNSLDILRVILKHPSQESFNLEELQYVLPDFMVFPTGTAAFRIAKDSKLDLIPSQGVILNDQDLQEESAIRRNFMPGKNPVFCKVPGSSHYRYQVDSLIKDHPVFEWEGVKYGAHLSAGILLKTLSPGAIREDLELLRRNGLMQNDRVRQWVNPYFNINLFILPQTQKL